MKQLGGKTAFITGGASGIGFGMAQAFLAVGMRVVIADIRQDHLQAVRVALGTRADVELISLDVTDRAAMAAAALQAQARFGKIHVLCNNAGVGPFTTAQSATYADWDWCLEVNLNGVFNGIHEFLPLILRHGEGGHIVNTASISAVLPIGLAYAATKCAVMGLSEGIAEELRALGVGVTCLLPGPVRTNIHEVAKLRPARYADTRQREEEAEMATRTSPPHWMDPQRVGRMVLDAIRRDLLFVFTHKEFREGVDQRFAAILDAIPAGPANAEEKRLIGFPVESPLYRDLLRRRPGPAQETWGAEP